MWILYVCRMFLLRFCFVVMCVLVFSVASYGQHNPSGLYGAEEYARAMGLYDQAQYTAALQYLEPLAHDIVLERDRVSYLPEDVFFYNLAGTYYKSGQYAQALASYIKSRSHYAYDPDLQINIQILQEKLDLSVDILALPTHDSLLPVNAFPLWLLLWISVFLSMLLLMVGIVFIYIRRKFAILAYMLILGYISMFVVSSVVVWSVYHMDPIAYGVMCCKQTSVYSSPSKSQVLLGHLKQYSIVRIHEKWVRDVSEDIEQVDTQANEKNRHVDDVEHEEYLRISFIYGSHALENQVDDMDNVPLTGWVKSDELESWDKSRF